MIGYHLAPNPCFPVTYDYGRYGTSLQRGSRNVVSCMLTNSQKVLCYSTEIVMKKQSKDGGLKPIIHTVSIVEGHYCW